MPTQRRAQPMIGIPYQVEYFFPGGRKYDSAQNDCVGGYRPCVLGRNVTANVSINNFLTQVLLKFEKQIKAQKRVYKESTISS